MCDSCFNAEIKSFESEEFKNFDLKLTNKLGTEKTIKYVKFVKTSEIQIDTRDYEDVGYDVYECIKCGQLWGLQYPTQTELGSFIRLTSEAIIKDESILKKKKTRKYLPLQLL